MMHDHETYHVTVSRALKRSGPEDIPAAANIWPKVQTRIVRRAVTAENRWSWPLLRILSKTTVGLVASLLLVTGGLAVSAAASPGIRDVLHRAAEQVVLVQSGSSSISVTGSDGFHDLQPVPPFPVLYLPALPSQVPVEQLGEILSSTSGPGNVVPAIGFFNCPQTEAVCKSVITAPGRVCDISCERIRDPFQHFRYPPDVEPEYEQGIATVWFWYSAVPPGTNYLHIVEHPDNVADAATAGDPLTIAGVAATLQQVGATTTIGFVHTGTAITLTTNLGRVSALEAAKSLITGSDTP